MAFSSATDLVRGAPVALELLVGGSVSLIRANRSGDPQGLATAMRRWARRAVSRLGVELDLRGMDHVDPAEQYVVVPLHEGFFDIAALLHLPLELRFSARQELADWRLLGTVLHETAQILVDPERPRGAFRAMLSEGRKAVEAGESLVVFPQGSVLGVEVAFQRGADALARAFGLRLLPLVLTGTHMVWEYPFSPLVRFGQPVTLEVLPPVEPGSLATVEGQMKTLALSDDRAPARRFVPSRDGFWDGYSYEIDPRFGALAAEIRDHRRDAG